MSSCSLFPFEGPLRSNILSGGESFQKVACKFLVELSKLHVRVKSHTVLRLNAATKSEFRQPFENFLQLLQTHKGRLDKNAKNTGKTLFCFETISFSVLVGVFVDVVTTLC